MAYRRIPSETRLKIMADYLLGEKVAVICIENKVDPTTLHRIIKQENIPRRGRWGRPPAQRAVRDWIFCATKM
jgi:hypothetical protein